MEDPNNPGKETFDRWSKDPNNWIYGIFYYNPKDKRIFPPKSVLTLIGILLFFALFTIIIQKIK